jgi:hypothetical protein
MTTNATTTPPPTFAIQRSNERYFADHGWLKSYHSLSFADYYDPANMNWGALRVFNDDYIAGGKGFPPHPHRDMEIVTYVLSGELEHRDSMGNRGVVGPGGVQFMSAGTGVRHSEVNADANRELHLVQMWVVPGKAGTQPTYGQQLFTTDDRRNRWLTVASGEDGVDAPIELTQDATFRVARLEGYQLAHHFAPRRYGLLFVADGTVTTNNHDLHRGDAVRLYDLDELRLSGSGEVAFWDVPALSLPE